MRNARLVLLLLLAVGFVAPAAVLAQAVVTAGDIDRLEATAADIQQQIESLRSSDPTLASEVSEALADLRDEVAYLRVKLRREGTVTRQEYADIRDRLETLRVRADGQRVSAQPVLGPPEVPSTTSIPVGTEFDVRLQTPLDSGTAKVEQRFEATTVLDYTVDGTVLVPAGSVVRGFVSSVRPAGRIDRQGSLTLSFDELRIENRSYPLRASVTQAIDGKVTEDVTRIGAGAAVGAILGGILGGARGALLGVLVGGGGTIAATDGSDVQLPVGTILRVRLDQRVDLALPGS
ncbi:MAG: hypothetical protein DIU54_012485 [Acidobacteriota bacterium]